MKHRDAINEIAKRIIGMQVDDARKQLEESGWSLRLVSIDGKGCVGTCDVRRDRINVKARNGIVTEYVSNG